MLTRSSDIPLPDGKEGGWKRKRSKPPAPRGLVGLIMHRFWPIILARVYCPHADFQATDPFYIRTPSLTGRCNLLRWRQVVGRHNGFVSWRWCSRARPALSSSSTTRRRCPCTRLHGLRACLLAPSARRHHNVVRTTRSGSH